MNFNEYKKLLAEFVSFKSISTDKFFVPKINKTVEWLKALFEGNGFKVELLQGPRTNPVVLASYTVSEDAETVLVYGHYDVQPALKEDGWDSDPFDLNEKDGRLVARGVVDNKGQVLTHIFTVLELIKENKLKYNVKFMVEGNEETSNEDMPKLVEENKEKLKADYVLISDGELASGRPAVETSLRGGFNLTLKVKTADNNLHSGIFGGAVPNASYELTKLLSKLYNDRNQVAVEGFYDDVDDLTPEQRENNKKLLKDEDEVLKMTGVKKMLMEAGNDFYSQVGLRPTAQITGIKTGYIGEGYSNIVPATAEARINFRTVMSQDTTKVYEAFKKFVTDNLPDYVEYEIENSDPYSAVKVDVSSEKVQEIKGLLKEAYDDEVLFKPVGGGIPVVTNFKDSLGADSLLVGLGNDDCNMHGVNENYVVDLCKKGLKFSELFFKK